MGGYWTGCRGALLPAILFLAACQGTAVSGGTNGSGVAASSAGSSTGAASLTGGIAPTSSSGATGGATSGGSGTSAAGGSSGSSTGNPFIDGGYVFCSEARSGGPASWLCQPGTYFCDPGGDGGNCFQCRTDADCANRALPTYDPARPRCDLDSGVGGHQNFCQQCLGDADCSGNQAGPDCDLELTDPFPPYGTTLRAPIVTSGFEACGRIEIDCRVDGGPDCGSLVDGVCDQATGACATRPADCTSDADCAGYQAYFGFGEEGLAPFCVDGGCSPCGDAGNCPEDYYSPGTTCPGGELCYCTSDAGACAGYWPVCEFPDGGVVGATPYTLGICGCDRDEQCGDGGLACIPASEPWSPYVIGYCGPSCLAPNAAHCTAIDPSKPICDAHTGACRACVTDGECAADPNSGGVNCGTDCFCVLDSDCSAGRICQHYLGGQYTTFEGVCQEGLPCQRGGCGVYGFCDWDSGECANDYLQCLADADCEPGECCVAESCGQCPVRGPGCGTGCADSPLGTICDIAPDGQGTCSCQRASDCNYAIASCQQDQGIGVCLAGCAKGFACPAGQACDSSDTCRPRCGGDAGSCSGLFPVCDTGNAVGANDTPPELPVASWCYGCVQASDCPEPLGCGADTQHFCGACQGDADCRSGEGCFDGICRALCPGGSCPAGQVCDTANQAGEGSGVCYGCLSPIDCPGGQGCNSVSHACGTCFGPTAGGGPFDCPPGSICSNYWYYTNYPEVGPAGACLQDCDVVGCAGGGICAVIPSLTSDHHYCVGCRDDSDCPAAGAWCDRYTYTCMTPSP